MVAQVQGPEVIRTMLLSIQVCVPADWTDEQVLAFAEQEQPISESSKWHIRKPGDPKFHPEDLERAPCSNRPGFVHILLDW